MAEFYKICLRCKKVDNELIRVMVDKNGEEFQICEKCYGIISDERMGYNRERFREIVNEHGKVLAGVKKEHLGEIEGQYEMLKEGDIEKIIEMRPVSQYLENMKIGCLREGFRRLPPNKFEYYLSKLVKKINYDNNLQYEKLIHELISKYIKLIADEEIYKKKEKYDPLLGWIEDEIGARDYEKIIEIFETLKKYYQMGNFYIKIKQVLTKTRQSKQILKKYNLSLY